MPGLARYAAMGQSTALMMEAFRDPDEGRAVADRSGEGDEERRGVMDKDVILKRADELLASTKAGEHDATQISEGYHGALNLLRVVHGSGSVQEAQLIQAMTTADKAKIGSRRSTLQDYVSPGSPTESRPIIASRCRA
jgi:hypothetical protein